MLLRRERPSDVAAIRAVHTDAFAQTGGGTPVEAGLVDALRADEAWIPQLSIVAVAAATANNGANTVDGSSGDIVGHVVATRGRVGDHPVLGLGPVGVVNRLQGRGIGAALMHAVLGAADAMGEPLVALLGHVEYYPRFGFLPATWHGIIPPDPSWGAHFQTRTLSAYTPEISGLFEYAAPFNDL